MGMNYQWVKTDKGVEHLGIFGILRDLDTMHYLGSAPIL